MTPTPPRDESADSSHRWVVRWETPEGSFAFVTISRPVNPLFRSEVEEWAEFRAHANPQHYKRVAACYTVDDSDIARAPSEPRKAE